ncbi:hypothetical protein NM688_g4088 [Phlebia brevispora]|uniref:Uncharacterized protein n=1 Tax=Phlebia brevispora TaxID=194682 RepID=A0ACC1T3X5_9APHY|nr:hypothetical protein NM688_g4088 [Phlebia brevispora]
MRSLFAVQVEKEEQPAPPLLSGEDGFEATEAIQQANVARAKYHARLRGWLLAIETVLLFVSFTTIVSLWRAKPEPTKQTCQLLYSPAQDAIKYETKTWMEDVWASNIYKGEPSEEVDKAWHDLYNDFGISMIPKSQAKLLPNPSTPYAANPEYYIVHLSVFHQMHCLNMIRMALRPEHYVDPVTGNLGNIPRDDVRVHINHCVDNIRQSLMCAGDITPLVWHLNDKNSSAVINMDIPHTCRNYDALVDWAKAHTTRYAFDPSFRVEDD